MDKHDTLLVACGSMESRKMLRFILDENYNLLEAVNLQQAVRLLEQNIDCIAAVLIDTTGAEMLLPDSEIRHSVRRYQEKVPVIVITADDSPEMLHDAFAKGVADVIPLQYDPYAMLRRIGNIVELNLHKNHLELLVEEQADILRHSNETMVDALSSIIEYRSVESGQHILRIRRFTKVLLEEVARTCPEYGLTEEIIGIISSAAALHDIGKISIPDSILTKPGKLTDEEWHVMKSHALTGCKILESLSDMGNHEYLRYAHNICHYHHERWDGNGYPEGIAGDDIPICAQVVGLADAYDALVCKRVYKEAYSFEMAVNMILNGECGVFAPKLLECFKLVSKKFEEVATSYADGVSPKTEYFDVVLPEPVHSDDVDSLDSVQTKYQSMLHYINAFVVEINLQRGHFHLLYNPYPEFSGLKDASTFKEIEEWILDKVVISSEKEQMKKIMHQDLQAFVAQGLRKQSFRFHFNNKSEDEAELYEITMMRVNPGNVNNQTVTILCRKIEEGRETTADKNAFKEVKHIPSDSIYCCLNDRGFTLVNMGDDTYNLAGYTADELWEQYKGQLIELVYPEDQDRLRDQFSEQLKAGTKVELEHRICTKSGSVVWVLNKSRLVVGSDGKEYLYCMLLDISSVKHTNDILNEKLKRYEIILAQSEYALFEWNVTGDHIVFSDTWKNVFGYDALTGKLNDVLMDGGFFHPDDGEVLYEQLESLKRGADYARMEVRIANSQGRYLWCRFRGTSIKNEEGETIKVVGIIINVDAEKREEKALQDRAQKDALTKLLNKDTGRRMAEEYVERSQTKGENYALLIIDLDNFKLVNDRYGHMFGDAILTEVAGAIKKLFRVQDIISRIGGDEFMVVMKGIADKSLVEKRCKQLLEIFEDQFRKQHYDLPLSCSIGVALAPEHGTAYYELFQHADQALYQAKSQGRNCYVFYDGKKFRVRSNIATAVNNRIDSDEQPGLADGNIVQHAFQRLYSSADVEASIRDILDLVGRQMNVSRVYIFENSADNKYCSNTYEWCNEGIPSEKENLQNVSYETDIPNYQDNFNEHGIFYCPDVTLLPKHLYDIVAPQGIKSMLHCAFRDNGVFSGYIGFDECVTNRMWTKEQIEVLTYFSEMLSVFLQKKSAQEKITRRMNDLGSILDNQNAWIYIVDPDTCELKYLNAKTKELASHAEAGMCCYRELKGLQERCPDCPAKDIRKKRTKCKLMYNERFGLRVVAEATLIQWDGEESCLLTCREVEEDPVTN